ncbi:rod shape-determining protein MreB [Alkalibaculum sp. M08DMB]|uniref:Cell shape-determining protein MreB n=1 Tax=Alkalibaculum sporogenes TaxID=2655001 RepID=A0A6A7KB39_9FIRM|nr:rod shape-determining protein [Alkalibaculum sporogenes]MPW26582.1 rod shape-determining protein MreB [Alkalibaculum sporogenes]
MGKLIAIDFGTSNTLIYTKGKGIIFEEPSVVALDVNTKKVLTVGKEAEQMIGKTPTNIKVIKPLKYGSIDKFDIAIKMLKMMIDRTKEGNKFSKAFSKASVLVGVPSSITQVETRGIEEVIYESGAKKVVLVKDVIADAVSLGDNVYKPSISFIVDIGGGTTDVAAIALGGILSEESIKIGGYDIDLDIIQFIKKNYNVEIGELTAQSLKIDLADVMLSEDYSMDIVGQDLASGLPVHIEITNNEIFNAIRVTVEKMISTIKKVIENCPPESASDILSNGITLVGGGSRLKNIDKLLESELGISANIVAEPEYATINGLGIMLDHIDLVSSMVLEYSTREIINTKTRSSTSD